MATCCSVEKPKSVKHPCPDCGVLGKALSEATLHHQLCFPDNMTVPQADFYYCATVECNVGYFSDSGITYDKKQLREKDHIQSGWLCYCFDISKVDYKDALINHNADNIRNFVIEQTKTGTCACTTRNPSGQCCLADFKKFEKEYKHEQR